MPIHPLVGQSLRVIRYGSGRVGERMVDLEHPVFGTTLRIPERWTELAEPTQETPARVTAARLLRLAEVVGALLLENADFLTATRKDRQGGS